MSNISALPASRIQKHGIICHIIMYNNLYTNQYLSCTDRGSADAESCLRPKCYLAAETGFLVQAGKEHRMSLSSA